VGGLERKDLHVKIGIVGKGGVGKTTVTALLARSYAADGARVLAIDTDSNPNLGVSLGLSVADMEAVPVLPRAVIVGTGGDRTPDELVRDYGRDTPAGVSLLSAIKVNEAGAGCMCGGHATVRSLLGTALEEQADVAIVDMEAGLEHLSRSGGTLAHADVLVVVMEPTRKSVLTASRTVVLAEELGIPRTVAVGNKARDDSDAEFFRVACAEYGVPLAGVLPHDAAVVAADMAGGIVDAQQGAAVLREVAALRRNLDGVPVA
jgi:CO dehydrogenase maturation factor